VIIAFRVPKICACYSRRWWECVKIFRNILTAGMGAFTSLAQIQSSP
jgi:hypothetical protein